MTSITQRRKDAKDPDSGPRHSPSRFHSYDTLCLLCVLAPLRDSCLVMECLVAERCRQKPAKTPRTAAVFSDFRHFFEKIEILRATRGGFRRFTREGNERARPNVETSPGN